MAVVGKPVRQSVRACFSPPGKARLESNLTPSRSPPGTSWSTDTADRLTAGSGYAYDGFGRATTVPAGDSPSNAALTLGYFDSNAARTITSGSGTTGTTTTYTLDPAGRRLQASK